MAKIAPTPEEIIPAKTDAENRENLLQLKKSHGSKFFIPICSILPYIYREADDLHKNNDLSQFKEIMELIDEGVPFAKWTVNLLVDYRIGNIRDIREAERAEGILPHNDQQKHIYKVGKDYSEEFQQAVKNIESTDLSHLKNSLEHIEANDKDEEFQLWQHISKIKKITKTIPEGKSGRLSGLTDLCLDSAYRISRKLKSYTDKYGKKILKGRPFGGR